MERITALLREREIVEAEAFGELLGALGKVRALIFKAGFLSEDDVAELSKEILVVAELYYLCGLVPIPKLHILCFHYLEFAAMHGSVGAFSEQLIESMHQHSAKMKGRLMSMSWNREKQLFHANRFHCSGIKPK